MLMLAICAHGGGICPADADAAQPMQHDTETPQAGAAPVDVGAAQPIGIAAPPVRWEYQKSAVHKTPKPNSD